MHAKIPLSEFLTQNELRDGMTLIRGGANPYAAKLISFDGTTYTIENIKGGQFVTIENNLFVPITVQKFIIPELEEVHNNM